MTLPFLVDDKQTINQIPNVWGTSERYDCIELAITNGDRLRYGVEQIDNIFFVEMADYDTYVCVVVILTGDNRPKRFVIRDQMAMSLVNHVNRRRFVNALSDDKRAEFFRGCK